MGKFVLIGISVFLVYFFFLWLEEKIYRSNLREDYYTIYERRVKNAFRIIRIAFYILGVAWLFHNTRKDPYAGKREWILFLIPVTLLLVKILITITSSMEKIIVMDDCLEIHRPFRKTLFLNISEIEKIQVTHLNKGSVRVGAYKGTFVDGYSKGKRVFMIVDSYLGYEPFCEKLCKMGLVEPSQLDKYK